MTRRKNPTRYGAQVWKPKRTSFGEAWKVEAFFVVSRRPHVSQWHSDQRLLITINPKRPGSATFSKWASLSVRPESVFPSEAEALRWAAYKDRALAAKLLDAADAADAAAKVLDASAVEPRHRRGTLSDGTPYTPQISFVGTPLNRPTPGTNSEGRGGC